MRRFAAYSLIFAEWVRREAKRRGITASATEVTASLDASQAKTPAALTQTRSMVLLDKLYKDAASPPPRDADIARKYLRQDRVYRTPEARYMRVLALDSRGRALAAMAALERGASWKAVIGRYSSKRRVYPPSGRMGALPREMPPALDRALYAARRGVLTGPVETDEAWFVFRLEVIDKLPRRTLAQARPEIMRELVQRQEARDERAMGRALRARYRPITLCHPKLLLPACRNGPTS